MKINEFIWAWEALKIVPSIEVAVLRILALVIATHEHWALRQME